MALARCNFAVQDEAGNIVDGASVEVRRESVGLPLVSVFSDRDGAVALGNPFTAADGADAGFHVAGGAYKITATLGAFTRTWPYVAVGLGQESDAVPVDGANAGFKFNFNTATSGDPGTGGFLFNHGTFASITALNISETDADANSLAALIARWDDGTSTIRGELTFVKPSTGAFRAFDITGTLTDNGGYDTFSATPIASGGTISNGDECFVFFIPKGDKGDTGAAGISGTSSLTRVRLVATANVVIATALENGDSLDSVTLATNDLVLLTAQTAPEENGVYVVAASGAAARHADFDAYDELPGTYFSVMEGSAKADTLWKCTSNRGGTIGVTAVAISEFTSSGGSDTNPAKVRCASTANVVLASGLENGDTIDGVALATGDKVLLWQQSTAAQNGIYTVVASGTAARHTDYDAWADLVALLVTVSEGTLYGDKNFLCTSNAGGTIDSTTVTFVDQTVPAGSTTTPGIWEGATAAETIAATDTTRVVTPEALGHVIGAKAQTIGDDAVATWAVPAGTWAGGGMMFSNIPGICSSFEGDTIGSDSILPLVEGSGAADIDWTTGVLTGTTGVDTNVTISITNDTIYVENRLGGSVVFLLILFGL